MSVLSPHAVANVHNSSFTARLVIAVSSVFVWLFYFKFHFSFEVLQVYVYTVEINTANLRLLEIVCMREYSL